METIDSPLQPCPKCGLRHTANFPCSGAPSALPPQLPPSVLAADAAIEKAADKSALKFWHGLAIGGGAFLLLLCYMIYEINVKGAFK